MHICNQAISYAERGWKVIQLHGVVEAGVCTCWKGKDCGTPGKHPVDAAWQLTATDDADQIESWFLSDKPVNVGLLLGPASGVIDVELDSDEAKTAWDDLSLGEIYTPTYTSGRGPHRLFRYDAELPLIGVKKPLGIEVRIGATTAIQSVLPPSRHHTGGYYQWIPGLSPEDVELAPLPDRLRAMLFNDDGTRIITREPARALIHRRVEQGERNNELYRFACREAARSPSIEDPQEQQDLLTKLRMVNQIQIVPPLPEPEVASIYRSSIAFIRKARAAGMDLTAAVERAEAPEPERTTQVAAPAARSWQRVFTEIGLSHTPENPGWDPEWGPGEWRLTVVHSDPLEFRLHVPAWTRYTANGTGNISLTVDQYRSATKVAAAALAATGVVMLDDEPGKWKRIWDGGERIAEGRDAEGRPIRSHKSRGVKAKMLDNVAHEWPGASSQRYVMLAGWLYDRLSQASQPNEEDTPDSTGRPSWRKDGTMWFNWSRLWEDVERQHRVADGERLAMKRRLLARMGGEDKDFRHAEFRHAGGSRKSYVVWSPSEFAVLESMATESP